MPGLLPEATIPPVLAKTVLLKMRTVPVVSVVPLRMPPTAELAVLYTMLL